MFVVLSLGFLGLGYRYPTSIIFPLYPKAKRSEQRLTLSLRGYWGTYLEAHGT